MGNAKRDEDDNALETILFGEQTPTVKDLADPRKRKQALRAAKMLGFEVRKEQAIRVGIGIAVVLVVLLFGLWAIAKVLGLLFWAVLALAAGAIVVKVMGAGKRRAKSVEASPARPLAAGRKGIDAERKRVEAEEREADQRADAALDALERKLNDK